MWGGLRGKGNMMGTEVIEWLERHQSNILNVKSKNYLCLGINFLTKFLFPNPFQLIIHFSILRRVAVNQIIDIGQFPFDRWIL
jgi:hypothetical protein